MQRGKHHETHIVASPSQQQALHETNIPPLSNYAASEYGEYQHIYHGLYKPVQDPQWERYAFHMIHDHPLRVAAQGYQERLEKDLQDNVIDERLYEEQSHNLRNRQKAVNHVLHGGIVADSGWGSETGNVLIHQQHIDPRTWSKHQIEMNLARFHTDDTNEVDGLGRQTLVPPWHHSLHEEKVRGLQIETLWERKILGQNSGTGRQRDSNHYGPSDVRIAEADDEAETPPPSPSPPRSPRIQVL